MTSLRRVGRDEALESSPQLSTRLTTPAFLARECRVRAWARPLLGGRADREPFATQET